MTTAPAPVEGLASTWQYDGTDECLQFWTTCLAYWQLPILPGQRVLEIGCAESNWLTRVHQVFPDLDLIGIDQRPCDRPGAVVVEDDVLTWEPPGVFDWVILISTLEHIGLGYYRDTIDPSGDIRLMERLSRWVRPGGSVVFDVPYSPGTPWIHPRGKYRVYNDDSLSSMQGGGVYEERGRVYADPVDCWTLRSKPSKARTYSTHDTRPFYYVSCWWERSRRDDDAV